MKKVPHPRKQASTRDPSEQSHEMFVERKPCYLVQPSIQTDVAMEGTTKGTTFPRTRYATQEPAFCIQHSFVEQQLIESEGSSSMHEHGACLHTHSCHLSHAIAYTGSKPSRLIHSSPSMRTRGAHELIERGHIRTARRENSKILSLIVASIFVPISPQSRPPLAIKASVMA